MAEKEQCRGEFQIQFSVEEVLQARQDFFLHSLAACDSELEGINLNDVVSPDFLGSTRYRNWKKKGFLSDIDTINELRNQVALAYWKHDATRFFSNDTFANNRVLRIFRLENFVRHRDALGLSKSEYNAFVKGKVFESGWITKEELIRLTKHLYYTGELDGRFRLNSESRDVLLQKLGIFGMQTHREEVHLSVNEYRTLIRLRLIQKGLSTPEEVSAVIVDLYWKGSLRSIFSFKTREYEDLYIRFSLEGRETHKEVLGLEKEEYEYLVKNNVIKRGETTVKQLETIANDFLNREEPFENIHHSVRKRVITIFKSLSLLE